MKISAIKSVLGVIFSLACLGCLVPAAQSSPVIKAGERMVFLGDSITEQRIYTRYVMDYFATHYPEMNVTFRNAGWGGDTSPGGFDRLKRDVLSQKPAVVSICFGMNDAHYQAFNQDYYDVYMKGMTNLVSELKQSGVKVVLLTPGCVDLDKNGGINRGYNDTLGRLADGVKNLAAKERIPVYDIHKMMLDIQTRAKAADPNFTMIPDGVHPAPTGQILMAYGLLNGLGVVSTASGLEIDASKASVIPDRCIVRDLKITNDTINFDRTDDALPTFYDDFSGVVKFAPYISDMNAYKLKVTGLKSGTWKLSVQGSEIGKFSSDALAAGIDLANYPGPWKKLAETANNLSSEQENLYFMRWRQIDLLGIPSEAKRETEGLLKKMDALVAAKENARAKVIANRTWEWSLTLEH